MSDEEANGDATAGREFQSDSNSARTEAAAPSARHAEVEAPQSEALQTQIFISYRVNPDEHVARALRRLIESSIEPAPAVFVSGAGGIRPSNQGAIPQIQNAAKSAVAFVGIITQASREREWMFFEAGAAWGRNVMYAPLLVGTSPEELPNTIEGYQATRSNNRDEMDRLIKELARVVNGTFKKSFGTRLAAFHRACAPLDDNASTDLEDGESSISASDPNLHEATRLMANGDYENADSAFVTLERTTTDRAQHTEMQIARTVYDNRLTTETKYSILAQLSTNTGDRPDLHFWLGLYSNAPHKSIQHYQDCLRMTPNSVTTQLAVTRLADAFAATGRETLGRKLLLEHLKSPQLPVRANAAQKLNELSTQEFTTAGKLILSCIDTQRPSGPDQCMALRRAITLCDEFGTVALGLHIARRLDREERSGTSATAEGICLAAAGLKSLAFLSYDRAAREGVNVAKANMAGLLSEGSVPSAGLQIMEQHSGTFDSLSPHSPHQLRAKLEELVHAEREAAIVLESRGSREYNMLVELADSWSEGNDTLPNNLPSHYLLRGARTTVVTTNDGFALHNSDDSVAAVFRKAFPLERTWTRDASSAQEIQIYYLNSKGSLLGIRIGVGVTHGVERLEDIVGLPEDPAHLGADA